MAEEQYKVRRCMKLVVRHWLIDSQENQITHVDSQEIIKLEPRAMEVLLYFAQKPGQVISRDELIEQIWNGRIVSDHAIYRVINQIRKSLDSTDKNSYLTTLSKKGYKLIQPVSEYDVEVMPQDSTQAKLEENTQNRKSPLIKYSVTVGVIAIFLLSFWHWVLAEKWEYSLIPVYSNMHPLTSDEFLEEYPNFSNDGRSIIFSQKKSPNSNYNLFVKNLSKNTITQLTDDDDNWINATVSNDAKTIIAIKTNSENCSVIAFQLVDEKYNQKELFGCSNNPLIDLDISDDGSIFYYTFKDEHNETNRVFSYLMRTGKKVQLTNFLENSAIGDHLISLSPDNKKLAFLRNDHYEETAIMIFDLESSKENVVSKTPGWIWSLSWDSSGDGIVYQTNGNKIEFQSTKYGFKKTLVTIPSTIRRLEHSSMSDKLAIVKQEFQYGVWKFQNPITAHSLSNAEKSNYERILVTNSLDFYQTFANTTQNFAFMSMRSGQQQIWIQEEGNLRQLTQFTEPRVILHLHWSPDDKYIATYSFGNKKISIIDTDTGIEKVLVQGDEYSNASLPTWSFDNKYIYFTSDRDDDYDLYQVSLDGGLVSKHQSEGRYWLHDSDNSNFYLKSNQPGLWFTGQGKEDILLIENIDESVYQSINIRGKNIYYQDSKNKSLNVYDLNTGQTKLINLIAKPYENTGFSVSYDEKYIIFSDIFKQESKIYLLSPES